MADSPLGELARDVDLSIDPDGEAYWIALWGPKKSGKSTLAKVYFASWPYDRIVIDPTRDFDPHNELTTDWPGGLHLPEPERGEERVSLRWVPNRRDENWRSVLERLLWAVKEAGEGTRGHEPRRIFLHIDEVKAVYPVNHIDQAGDTILNEGRHYNIFQSTCGPRLMGVDPLVPAQADSNFVFGLLHEIDSNRLAVNTSLDKKQLHALTRQLEKHGFLRIWTHEHRVAIYPPLPPELLDYRGDSSFDMKGDKELGW